VKYEQLYKKAIRHAKIKGYSDIAEDFGGWISIKWLEGKSQHQTINQSFIDFLRLEYGGVGYRRGSDAILRTHRQPQAEVSGCDESTAEETIDRLQYSGGDAEGDLGRSAQVTGSDVDPRSYLSSRLGHIYHAYIKEERTLAQVGKDFGLTESRVSQLMTKIEIYILQYNGLRKIRELVDEGRTSLDIEWINI